MRKTVATVSIISVALLVTACEQASVLSNQSTDEDTYLIRLGENQPEDYPTMAGNLAFAEIVEERTNGRITIDIYSGGQIGDERSSLEHVQIGSIGMARSNASTLSEFATTIGVLSMPYLFESEEAMWNVLKSDIGDDLLDSLHEAGYQGLTFYDSGSRHIYNTKKPIESPEDLQGLQIRVQESQVMISMVEALGATASTMSFSEVYSALQTGVVDGAENNFPSFYTTNHFEVANHLSLNAHGLTPEVLLISKELFDGMSEEDQNILVEAAEEASDVQREAWDELEQEALEHIEDRVNIVEIDDFSEWRETVQPVYDQYGGQFQEWIDRIEAAQS
ncbi:TRAP transporter substrate-binding protein [Alkalicoccobacillus porphyridii]|uniref:TRAP transporter substrate-binding protein n=1 Tax=Alkalicoccobacillus porphyridii TaxID=2597270 RepID=A0A554A0Q4_9BACI|nr:TRAP transporter substrate-binding protein [Alkalicoccobacillus porphyridii]TSB47268.1 TRAP transporter substrate-binding protein [Alkalicoccobacillus porphyridii]